MKQITTLWELQEFVRDYEELKKLARSLHKLYEHNCNYGLTKRQYKRLEKLEQKVKQIAQKWGLIADICTDPRGMPICLIEEKDQFRYNGLVIPFK